MTGHRDPLDPQELSGTIRDRLTEICDLFRATEATPVRFGILSALAKGADRLVVREAIDLLKSQGMDVELHAVLPLDLEDYRGDFHPKRSRPEFDEMLATATVRTQMPQVDDRDEAYERAGCYIVDHSDVMVALWDGNRSTGRGGTAEIVGYARKRGVPVLVVPTSRTAHAGAGLAETLGESEPFAPPGPALTAFRRVEEYNRQSNHIRGELSREQARLYALTEGATIQQLYETVAIWALPHFVRADTLAVKCQRLYYRSAIALYSLAAMAVTVVAAQSEFSWPAPVALVEIAAMLGVLGIYGYAHYRRLHERWLGYRSLAEAFRSALFITMAGVSDRRQEDEPTEVGEHDEPWYQRAFSEAWRNRPVVTVENLSAEEVASFLGEGWIEHQIGYQRLATKRARLQRNRINIAMLILFAMTIAVATLHATGVVVGSSWTPRLLFLAIALPSFGAALTGIRDQRQYRLHEVRSTATAARLMRLSREILLCDDLRSVQKVAVETQALMESENLDWSGVLELQDLELIV